MPKTSEIFIEQAEYLSVESFTEWSTSLHNEAVIIKKLSQSGAKLITGPRGCGKTTLLLKVYNKCLRKKSSTIPVYVNFKSSLKLEPLYRVNTNAAFWFNQWLLNKVLHGFLRAIQEMNIQALSILPNLQTVEHRINDLEMGKIATSSETDLDLSVLVAFINEMLVSTNKSRCILLLDDAGHAFSSDQQHAFFEFFREIKTRNISPKAAVYPPSAEFLAHLAQRS